MGGSELTSEPVFQKLEQIPLKSKNERQVWLFVVDISAFRHSSSIDLYLTIHVKSSTKRIFAN